MDRKFTLLGLLEDSGQPVRIYDVGRRIGALSRDLFAAFEAAETPYPLPMQRKAWFALVQTGQDDDAEPVIWFLHLSLDEQGLLIPAERDYLLDRLLESAQARQRGGDPQDFLRDNPHAFTPRDDRMALFHARLSADLGRPPSRFYSHALAYFRGIRGWEQWEFVGYQGIADVACRHAADPLDAAIPNLPMQPLIALCHCLESAVIGESLQSALCARLTHTLRDRPEEIGTLAALVRALASRSTTEAVRQVLRTLLTTPAGRNIEVLAAISGRAWEALDDRATRYAYLAALAHNDHGQAAFAHAIRDLLSVPTVAQSVREALRADDQATEVRAAFAAMTNAPLGAPD